MRWRRYLVTSDIWDEEVTVVCGQVKRHWHMKRFQLLRRLWIEYIGVLDRG